ncbi:MAG: hypothetical protein C0412_14005 [Flavobacterium sp.]|nr:hypothetical protein [Flavobacterium sp.]
MRNEKIILGTAQMGLQYGINNTGRLSFKESHEILNMAFNEDVRVLDTAEAYGDAHQVIGTFHNANPEKKFGIITKISPSANMADIESRVEKFRNELGVVNLEALMFHSFSTYKKFKDSLFKFGKLKDEGAFKFLGVSIYSNNELEVLIHDDEIDLIQVPFNLLDNFTYRGKLMNEAKRKGKIIHSRSAFLQGLFFKSILDGNPIVLALKDQLLKIHEISENEGVSIHTLALGYCLAQKCIDNVIIGVDSVSHLQLNLEAAFYQMDKSVIQKINQIQTGDRNLLTPSLWDRM